MSVIAFICSAVPYPLCFLNPYAGNSSSILFMIRSRTTLAMMEAAAALEKSLGEPESVKAVWKPQNNVPVEGDKAATLVKMIGLLEDDDDIQDVYANYEMSDEDAARLG